SPDNGIINIYTKKRENTIALHIKNDGATFTQENYLQTLSSQENSSSINGIGLRLVDELSKKINATVTFLMPANGGTLVEINLKIV
ncbi:MAG TPA: ATP-binding protein, partial [Chitinophagaceae bacterium]|nr:ATP-binding protein [Chitinophagaceae bacterium]